MVACGGRHPPAQMLAQFDRRASADDRPRHVVMFRLILDEPSTTGREALVDSDVTDAADFSDRSVIHCNICPLNKETDFSRFLGIITKFTERPISSSQSLRITPTWHIVPHDSRLYLTRGTITLRTIRMPLSTNNPFSNFCIIQFEIRFPVWITRVCLTAIIFTRCHLKLLIQVVS